MINISLKKGFALALAIYFVILCAITSIGIYAYSGHIVRETVIDKGSSTRGYYYKIAGLRYAYIALKDPTTQLRGINDPYNLGDPGLYVSSTLGISDLPHNGDKVTLTIGSDSLPLGAELHLKSNEIIKVSIEEWNTDVAEWANGNYKVTATYQS
ncbi:MAG: hypothetical protein Q8R38_06680 [Candidatus Omnitrophota bacterium]|nr:hypothetical protein [Candidatus Omnitrophota bacterium]